MVVRFGREICGNLETAESREWLVTNGIGGFAAGTIAGMLTRRYHGLLIAALQPPLGRTLLVSKLEETANYQGQSYSLSTNRWTDGSIDPQGYLHLESFHLEGTILVWQYACADALLEKKIWMQQGQNTTYIQYHLVRGTEPLKLNLKALINCRDFHGITQTDDKQISIRKIERGVCVNIQSLPLYLFATQGNIYIEDNWYYGFDLAVERYRGLSDYENHFHAATFNNVVLEPNQSITIIASTEANPNLDAQTALANRRTYEENLLKQFPHLTAPDWIKQLVLAADQFIVSRTLPNEPDGKTIIAGYPWFGDWGRDTMISLTGLTLATGRSALARPILRTFAYYLDRGMLPNVFPDQGETPYYNTVDATLWYFEAIRAYYEQTKDDELLTELFPKLAEMIDWHKQGTRYNIAIDPNDGLLYAGEEGVQLTWMDAKVNNWVVTPRIGKPVEVNALWYNALTIMQQFAQYLGKSEQKYTQMAAQTAKGFQRFWCQAKSCCYDVLDSPQGNDASVRPNQIFAVSLPANTQISPLLTKEQQKAVVDTCARLLLTSHGLRSLSPHHADYQGHYGGGVVQRDGSYHQGTVWGWLIGAFVQAHLKVYQNPAVASTFLQPMANHLQAACVGNLSEIFDGDPPFTSRGAFAQAWTVAEVLRVWVLLNQD
ncbi:glycogen debranching enzyme [Stanieria cyanosphaera PCC 7437]|uniref:Glycogen debranching enzyme n=1 Tax=Stanieria cyanosphaera (strain ATCC 29371 / PCC 7437) TaxID=111780 RepID=K9XT77_STAC7|nr:amylo-alpha-1,6-glucosidase [Stanieria cyanosphaera]AFZ35738.1 glycogen debranching enzyme [Stanieria cyanosphaera PCC 7437]